MSLKDWDTLNVTRDEVNKIGEALKHKEFRQLFVDYCEEIQDPENRKLYESEITQLQNERGVDITFINPEPGYVIKTSSDGTMKAFINVATNEKIDKPSHSVTTSERGQKGLTWRLPHILAPPRRDLDKKGELCHVYDIVFHPDALHLASRNSSFRQLVNDTAIDAVQQNFKVQLDRANIKFPKGLTYKGIAKPTVIRKKIHDFDGSSMEASPIDGIYPPMPDDSKLLPKEVKQAAAPVDSYTTPKYKIVQRRGVEFHEMTYELDAKINMTVPHELVITIDLPLLTTTQEANLDVSSKKISLLSEKPAKYKLDIALPYEVLEENGSAKFDKSKRQLIIALPVVKEKSLKMTDFHREDSGIESDQFNKMENSDEAEDESPVGNDHDDGYQQEAKKGENQDVDYILPTFTFNHIDEILAFTLHVKNVDPSSISIERQDLHNTAQIKFTSIGSGFFPIHYSFCVKFPLQKAACIFRDINAEAWDNNVIFQFELNNYDFSSYEVGVNDVQMENYDIAERLIGRQAVTSQGKDIEDDSLSIEVRSHEESEVVIEVSNTKKSNTNETTSNDDEVDVFEQFHDSQESVKRQNQKKAMKKRAKKARSMSESFCDELKVINEMDALESAAKEEKRGKANARKGKQRTMSESSDDNIGDMPVQNHFKYKSILKNRNSLSECNEMSSAESHHHHRNFYSMSADCGISESHDSLSESCKKTVRFSDTIKKQLFR